MARKSEINIVLLVIMLIFFLIPGILYIIFGSRSVIVLVISFLCGFIPGLLYLLWPSGGFR